MIESTIRRTVLRVARKYKGESYAIDDAMPPAALLDMVGSRVVMKLRGIARFHRIGGAPFVGRGARIKSRGLIGLGAGVTFAERSFVDATSRDGVVLGSNTSLGKYTRIECTGNAATLGKGFVAGDNVGLGSDCFYGAAGGITVGTDTIVGNYVSMHSENHVSERIDVPIRTQGVTHVGISIGADCWIGAKATVLDGVVVEDHVIVAAGSVLTAGRYEAGSVYAGVPARLIKKREQ
ncbi:hypothetical protein GCM10007304_48690 [Rhodococcoides trifolii]|uniref:Acyltransferase n=1 Tax=Rhodococcoides trifolii TaxID=908250 RepID=A0A917G8Z1_9NOCA|nr:acyltransferase [Rhodococcus trifolii]GGG29076.1 hypothetical protein GCM10007304_48690 [Rhodococcus trifolii]